MRTASAIVLGWITVLAAAAGAVGGADAQESSLPRLPYEGKDSAASALAAVDWGLVLRTWRAKGVGACYNGVEVRICLRVENAYPTGIFEVVAQRGRSRFAEWGPILEGLAPLEGLGGSGNHSPVSGDGTALHYRETRVTTRVPSVSLESTEIPIAIPSGPTWEPSYVSELDDLAWRTPDIDHLLSPEARTAGLASCERIPDPITCAWRWGSFYPRGGFVTSPSSVKAAFMTALRAGRVASRPLGRIVLSPYPFEPRAGHWIQRIRPSSRAPISIGSPFLSLTEKGAASRWGESAYLHYGIFEDCKRCQPVILLPPRAPE